MTLSRTKFHKNLLSGSEVINGGHTNRKTHRQTDGQTGDLISLLSFFEYRLKWHLMSSL
jgi:hypothetical protein